MLAVLFGSKFAILHSWYTDLMFKFHRSLKAVPAHSELLQSPTHPIYYFILEQPHHFIILVLLATHITPVQVIWEELPQQWQNLQLAEIVYRQLQRLCASLPTTCHQHHLPFDPYWFYLLLLVVTDTKKTKWPTRLSLQQSQTK
jgi:hypothetical protein